MRKLIPTVAALLALAPAAYSQGHSHGDKTGPHGQPLQDVAGVEAELVRAERTLTVHLYEEDGKPVPAAGYSGSVLVGSGGGRQVVQLTPGSDNALTGVAGAAVARGTPVVLQLKAPGGRTGQARF